MRKIAAFALAIALLLLFACGENAVPEETAVAVQRDTSSPSVIVIDSLKAGKGEITQINLAAPENSAYLNWLEDYHAAQSNWESNEFKWDSKRQRESEGKTETWETYDWNDNWELEKYFCYTSNEIEYELRARGKTNGEALVIFNNKSFITWEGYDVKVRSVVSEESLVYQTVNYEDLGCMYLYTLGQGAVQVGNNEGGAFVDRERKILCWDEIDFAGRGIWWNGALGKTMVYADLPKLAVGESDAIWRVTGKNLGFCSVNYDPGDCRLAVLGRGFPDENEWDGEFYLAVCDAATGDTVYAGKLPRMPDIDDWGMWAGSNEHGTLEKVDSNTYYYFERRYLDYDDNVGRYAIKPPGQIVFYKIKIFS